MAAIDTSRPSAVLSAGGISSKISALFGAVAAWNDARVTRASLTRLSARELEDIGLSFGDIEAVATRISR